MRKVFLIILPLLWSIAPVCVCAKTYYVSPSGKNSNVGTSASLPWQTTAKVNATIFNGDTILFLGGSNFSGGITLTSTDVGSATKPIFISSYGTGRATLKTDSLTHGFYANNTGGIKIYNINFKGPGITKNDRSGIIFYLDKASTTLAYINISYVEVSGFRYSGISVGSWKGASGYSDVTVKYCSIHDNGLDGISTYAQTPYVHKNVYLGYNKVYNITGLVDKTTGNSGSGIVLGDVKNGTVEYCTSYNNGALHVNPNGGPVGIWAYESSNLVFQYNESHHNRTGNSKDGGGFDLDGGCANSILQYNYSHDNYGAGYLVAEYSGSPVSVNNIIRYNISENDGRKNDYGAIHIWSYTSSAVYIQNLEIYNNTVYVSSLSGTNPKGFYVRGGAVSGVNLRNNIFQIKGNIKLVNSPVTTGITMQGNAYWPSGSTFSILWGTTTYSSLAAWQSATGQEKLNGSLTGIQVDPKYSDTSKSVTYNDATKIANLPGYRLANTSALINKGLNLSKVFGLNVGSRDFWGNALAGKTAFNIGAFQGTPIVTALQTTVEVHDAPMEFEGHEFINVFPNPVSDMATIAVGKAIGGEVKIQLFDIEGRLVKSIYEGPLPGNMVKKLTINLSSLNKGVYTIRLIDKEGERIQKGILKL